ncbi:YggT family protein [Clostridiaceae bacterium 35-E11]
MWIIRESVDYFFKVLDFLIIARIILSWINPNPNSNLTRLLYQLTEPILAPFRNLLFKFGLGGGMVDFSPILAVFALNIIRTFVLTLI